MPLLSTKERLTTTEIESQVFAKRNETELYIEDRSHKSIFVHFIKNLVLRPVRLFRFATIGKIVFTCILSLILIYKFSPQITQYAITSSVRKIDGGHELLEFTSDYGMEKLINNPEKYSFQWRDWVNMTYAYNTSATVKNDIRNSNIWPLSLFQSDGYSYYTEGISGISGTEMENDIRGKVYLDCCAPKPKKIITLDKEESDLYLIVERPRFAGLFSIFNKGPSEKELYEAIERSQELKPNPVMLQSVEERQEIKLSYDDFFFDIEKRINIDHNAADIEQKVNAARTRSQVNDIPESSKHFYEVMVRGDRKNRGQHYDWRFFKNIRNNEDKQDSIHHLMRTWFEFSEKEGIISWIAHGSLLGWYWNGMTMTWDTDADIQMPIKELDRFARKYNQTLVVQNPEFGDGRYYIDVTPAYVDRGRGNYNNLIDARFIDIRSGIYLDITGLAYSPELTNQTGDEEKAQDIDMSTQLFQCKNQHRYALMDISPLRRTLFEGGPTYIPDQYEKLLTREYRNGLRRKRFNGYVFVDGLQNWESNVDCLNLIPNDAISQKEIEEKSFDKDTGELTLFGACENQQIFDNFHRYKAVTDLHRKEMEAIAAKNSTYEFIKDVMPYIRNNPK